MDKGICVTYWACMLLTAKSWTVWIDKLNSSNKHRCISEINVLVEMCVIQLTLQMGFSQDHIFHSIPSSVVFTLSVLRGFCPIGGMVRGWWMDMAHCVSSSPFSFTESQKHKKTGIKHQILLPFVCIQSFISFFPLMFCGFNAFWTVRFFPLEYHSSFPFVLSFLFFSLLISFLCISFFLHLSV